MIRHIQTMGELITTTHGVLEIGVMQVPMNSLHASVLQPAGKVWQASFVVLDVYAVGLWQH